MQCAFRRGVFFFDKGEEVQSVNTGAEKEVAGWTVLFPSDTSLSTALCAVDPGCDWVDDTAVSASD